MISASFLLSLAWLCTGQTVGIPSGSGSHQSADPETKRPSKRHWAFTPVVRPPVPAARVPGFEIRNPIDAFTAAKLHRAGVNPPASADRRTLIRRVYLDLLGLPPTIDEVRQFVHDRRPDAFERVVDELLTRPQYGERWARHWLDVVRYAESNGYERDGNKPNAWRYRDYVIDAFNRDKPYDRFVVEQIAGDEIDGSTSETQIATTFLRLGTWDDEPADPAVDRYDQLDDVLGTTAAVFLAQTLRCARCHDHKFEPFSQKDYYRFLAVFEPLKRPQNDRTELDRPVGTVDELKMYEAASRRMQEELAPVLATLDPLRQRLRARVIDAPNSGIAKEVQDAIRVPLEKRTDAQKSAISQAAGMLDTAAKALATEAERRNWEDLARREAEVERNGPREPPRAYVWQEDGPVPPKTNLLRLGNPQSRGDEVSPAVPAILRSQPVADPVARAGSSGRRFWLANWITSPKNPLTARVLVNRVWQWHFGQGLVASANDFGVMGQRPSDRMMLDWLASEFVSSGWSVKRLHRLIVTSSTYRMTSQTSAIALKVDPDNRIPSRWPTRRVEAETYRDATLHVSGTLNPEMGGPSIYPQVPRSVLEGQSVPGQNWTPSIERQSARRSVYIFVKRSLGIPELEVMDSPDTTSSCERRPISTVAPQALTFLNGEFMRDQATRFAQRLAREAGDDGKAQIRLAHGLALARDPSHADMKTGSQFLADQEALIQRLDGPGSTSDARLKALASYCLVLLNTSEFAYIR